MKRVFIIGNGFDLAHGLKTGYFAFRDFLKSTDRPFYDQIKEYNLFEGDDLWRNFESNLSKIDVETLTSYANLRCNDDMDYDSMEGDNIDIAVAEELNYIDGLSEKIREWVSGTVDLSACNKIIASSYLKDSLWLTFNYTHTLEDLYEIDPNSILHIHGDAENYYEELIMGHGNDEDIAEIENECQSLYSGREYGAKKAVVKYLQKSRKPVTNLIENHEAYFKDYESADEIYILGFSFGDVDMPYVEKIASESPKATIYVSFYDVNSIPEFLNKMMKYIERIKFFKIEGLGSYPPTYVLK